MELVFLELMDPLLALGAQNTIDIEAGCTTSNTAADHCANLTLNGYSDWFLPSIDELQQIYTTVGPGSSNNIAGINSDVYWSSTPKDGNYAKRYNMNSSSGAGNANKSNTNYVRAIRAF